MQVLDECGKFVIDKSFKKKGRKEQTGRIYKKEINHKTYTQTHYQTTTTTMSFKIWPLSLFLEKCEISF